MDSFYKVKNYKVRNGK